MIEIRLGDRYAVAILRLAEELNEIENVRKDFQKINDICNSNPDFVNMLKSPLIMADKKSKIFKEIFGSSFTNLTQNFIEIIIRKHREMFLQDISIRFLHQYDKLKNITRGTLKSASALSDSHRKAIQDLVEKEMATQFEMKEQIDPELIGGFILRIGDHMFDGSLASKLRDLKYEFEHNPYEKKV